MKLHDLIKTKRTNLNMTQQQLATAIGYDTKSTISHIENDNMKIDCNVLKRMIPVLRISPKDIVDYFFGQGVYETLT